MFVCKRSHQHACLPSAGDGDGRTLCLTCMQAALPAMPLAELTDGLRVMAAALDGLRGSGAADPAWLAASFALPSSSHGGAALGAVLGAVARLRGGGAPPPQSLAAALTAALGAALSAFAAVLWAADSAPRDHHHYRQQAAQTQVLGMTQATESPSSPPPPPPPLQPSLPLLARGLLAVYAHALRDGQRAEAAAATALLADTVERSAPLRAALAGDLACLSLLLAGLLPAEVLPRHGRRTVDSFLFLLYQLFAEARQTPCGLELLAATVGEAATQCPGGCLAGALCAVAVGDSHGEDPVTVLSALSLLHFLLSHATTQLPCLGGGGAPAAAVLRAVAPLVLAADEATAALACVVLRLTVGGAEGRLPPDLVAWLADYAAEALLAATVRTAPAALALIDELAAVAGSGGGGEAALRLEGLAHLAVVAPAALEAALDGACLRGLARDGGLSADDWGAFARRLVLPPDGAPPPSLAAVVRLAGLLARAAGDPAAVAAEYAGPVARAIAERLQDLTDAAEGSGRSLGEALNEATLTGLLAAIDFFLPRCPDLRPAALQALADFTLSRLDPDGEGDGDQLRGTAGGRRVAALVGMAAHLLSAGLCTGDGGPRLAALAQAGLVHRLLEASAGGHDDDGDGGATAERRLLLVMALAPGGGGPPLRPPSLRGAASLEEVLLRRCPADLCGRVLTGLALLGCGPPLPAADLSQLTLRALAAMHAALERRDDGAEAADGTDTDAAGDSAAVVAAVACVLRLRRVHLHWYGACPLTNVGEDKYEGEGAARALDDLCARRSIRKGTAAALAALEGSPSSVTGGGGSCFPAALPGAEAVVAALLSDAVLFPLGVHLCLAAVAEGPTAALCSGTPWGRLLVAAAPADDAACLLGAVFSSARRAVGRRRGRDLALRLLSLLPGWLGAVAAADKGGPGGCAEAAALAVLERHCAPLLLSWGAAPGPTAPEDWDGELAAAVAGALVAALSRLAPADGSGSDAVALKWCLRALAGSPRGGPHRRPPLQLLCLLLERSHGCEAALRYGETVLRPLLADVGGGPTTAVLVGAISLVLASLSPQRPSAWARGGWRRWPEFVPAAALASGRARAAAVRAMDFAFAAVESSGPVTPAPARLPAAERCAVLSALDSCLEVLLGPEASLAGGPLCCWSAGRAARFLLESYRAALGGTMHVAALVVLCGRGGAALARPAAGWLLAGLLHVAPLLPWGAAGEPAGAEVAALARQFLSSLDAEAGGDEIPRRDMSAMLEALAHSCRCYAAAVPGCGPFPLHRAADFYGVSDQRPAAVAPHFLIQNDLNVRLTS